MGVPLHLSGLLDLVIDVVVRDIESRARGEGVAGMPHIPSQLAQLESVVPVRRKRAWRDLARDSKP
jgi:hypothetical protein